MYASGMQHFFINVCMCTKAAHLIEVPYITLRDPDGAMWTLFEAMKQEFVKIKRTYSIHACAHACMNMNSYLIDAVHFF